MNPPPTTQKTAPQSHSAPLFPRNQLLPFVLVTALFFLWGIPNNLNDVLIRQFIKSFEMTRLGAGLIQFAFYLGYFFLSMPAALIMQRYGYKTGLVTGLLLYSLGTILFWPAAIVQSYAFFLFALFVIASGLAFLESGSSPFIAELGDPHSSERRLNFSQSFNTLGSITGALAGTMFIFSGVELTQQQVAAMKAAGTYKGYLQQETMRVVVPYLVLACVVLFWATLIIRTKFPKLGSEGDAAGPGRRGDLGALLRSPHFVLAVLAQFFYVGAQVGTWSYFIQYAQDYAHVTEKIAGYLLSGNLVAFAVGRFTSTYIMRFFSPHKLMGVYACCNVALLVLAVFFPSWLGVWAVLLTSFFMSLMFPTIFALGIKGLGPNTKLGGSLIVMAIVGGALFPLLMGFIATSSNMAQAMLVPLACYVFIAYYSFAGSQRVGSHESPEFLLQQG
jgi:FHS family L-fucose permease-like MFS transporter